jgi:putative membrane protein
MSVAAVLLLTACQSPTATSTVGASSVDVEFVTNAYQLITFDRQEGELARTEAMDPQVRALSAKIVDDANRFAAKLAAIAATEGIQQPDVLDYGRRVRLSPMRLQHGLDFDEAYINDQIASHQEALSMHEIMTSSEGNPQLRALAEQARPLVRENLAQLQTIQRKMMMRR